MSFSKKFCLKIGFGSFCLGQKTLIFYEIDPSGRIKTLLETKAPKTYFKAKFLKETHKGKYSAKYKNIVVRKNP